MKRIRGKYGNLKTVVDGKKFDSKREARRYQELCILQRTGDLQDLKLQPRYKIEIGGVKVCYASGRQVVYVADFEYVRNGHRVIEDAKGMSTPVYKLKKALMAAMGNEINEV